MADSETTCWTVIKSAAEGNARDRSLFAERYLDSVRAYLKARWRHSRCREHVDDAVQEVFVECFRPGGPLDRVEEGKTPSFRAFLYGLIRNVALRVESRQAAKGAKKDARLSREEIAADEDSLSRIFDRAWAVSVMKQAGQRHRERARASGEAAQRRAELLRLRFNDGLPIRTIAARWDMDAAVLHREYSKARAEFREALEDVVRFHHPGTNAEVRREAEDLLAFLA